MTQPDFAELLRPWLEAVRAHPRLRSRAFAELRFVELEAQLEPGQAEYELDQELSQDEAWQFSGEVSKDRFARNPIWRRALVRTYGRPRYSFAKLKAIKKDLAKQAEIAA